MTTKHTQGPWRVVPSNGMAWDEWLVEVASDEFLTPGIAEVYEEADARLIAAAPDLLEMLELMAAQHRCGCRHPACKRCRDDDECAAIIARAKGGAA